MESTTSGPGPGHRRLEQAGQLLLLSDCQGMPRCQVEVSTRRSCFCADGWIYSSFLQPSLESGTWFAAVCLVQIFWDSHMAPGDVRCCLAMVGTSPLRAATCMAAGVPSLYRSRSQSEGAVLRKPLSSSVHYLTCCAEPACQGCDWSWS